MADKVKKIMWSVIDCSVRKEHAMEILRTRYAWLYPYITPEVYKQHHDLYLSSKAEEELPDEHFKCDRCKAVKHCDEYVSLDNDTSGNTICEECIPEYVKENGLEDEDE